MDGGPSGFYGDLDDISFGGNHSCSQTITSNPCSTGNQSYGDKIMLQIQISLKLITLEFQP